MKTNLKNSIFSWLASLIRVWCREYRLIFSDSGVILFFFILTLFYPIIYTLIYNPEIVTDIPIVVVDQSRSEHSREMTRMIDATQAIKVYDYAPTLNDARIIQNNHKAYGILVIPSDFDKKLERGEQASATFYTEMSLLLRYRAFVATLSDVMLFMGAKIQQEKISTIGLVDESSVGTPIHSEAFMLGNPEQGFASFAMPGILVLIIQQSLLLGVTMLAAGATERRRRNNGIDPLSVSTDAGAIIIGKTLCYVSLYIPICIYILDFIPVIFNLPHIGLFTDYILFIIPMLVATSLFGICISIFVTERECSLLVLVFTSVIFLFLSGLTWPRYAMSDFWIWIGNCIPATWGIEGFIRINSNGSTLAQETHPYTMLWVLSAIYFIIAYLITHYRNKHQPRQLDLTATH